MALPTQRGADPTTSSELLQRWRCGGGGAGPNYCAAGLLRNGLSGAGGVRSGTARGRCRMASAQAAAQRTPLLPDVAEVGCAHRLQSSRVSLVDCPSLIWWRGERALLRARQPPAVAPTTREPGSSSTHGVRAGSRSRSSAPACQPVAGGGGTPLARRFRSADAADSFWTQRRDSARTTPPARGTPVTDEPASTTELALWARDQRGSSIDDASGVGDRAAQPFARSPTICDQRRHPGISGATSRARRAHAVARSGRDQSRRSRCGRMSGESTRSLR